ncbi:unnamed protein product [Allacma fusca]|uniref:Uncharacterized protein n=1 Tax=Allacma fusca TaxID=39272 RepID=A0A8J2K084_9HEXA|nr:unnamed protein product [Allacma fusca]
MLNKVIPFLIPSIFLVVIPGIISDGRTCPDVSMECDGVMNCPDGSDEDCYYCVEKHNGMCCDGHKYIPPNWECDGYLDCDDTTDETTCGCECTLIELCHFFGSGRSGLGPCLIIKVPAISFYSDYCPYEKHCLPKAWICDKWSNCADRSDEKDCPCDGPNDFLCEDGYCTNSSWVCNGVNDCWDGSDEEYYCNSTIRSGVEGVLAPEKKAIPRNSQILSESASKKQAKSQGWQK